MSDDAHSSWQQPTLLASADGDIMRFANTLVAAPWPPSKHGINDGIFFSLWMHTPDIANEVKGTNFSFYQPLVIEGDQRRFKVAVDNATLTWLNGRRVGYDAGIDAATGRVHVKGAFVQNVSEAERTRALTEHTGRATEAGKKGMRFKTTVVDLAFDEFIARFLAEPGRLKTVGTFHVVDEQRSAGECS